jgi:hypothetical protein
VEASKPSETREAKQEAIREITGKAAESTRITRLAQERLHWPWTALDRRSESSKTDGVVPPIVVIYNREFARGLGSQGRRESAGRSKSSAVLLLRSRGGYLRSESAEQ